MENVSLGILLLEMLEKGERFPNAFILDDGTGRDEITMYKAI